MEENSSIPKPTSDEEEMLIAQAIEKWPEALSHAFYFEKAPRVYYFIMKKQNIAVSTIRSVLTCLVLDMNRQTLSEQAVTIYTDSEVAKLTFKDFGHAIQRHFVLLSCRSCKDGKIYEQLYRKHGFI